MFYSLQQRLAQLLGFIIVFSMAFCFAIYSYDVHAVELPQNEPTTLTGIEQNKVALVDAQQVVVNGSFLPWLHQNIAQRELFVRLPINETQLDVVRQELTRKDAAYVIPPSAINIQLEALSNRPNEFKLTFKVDLNQVPASGEYAGKLRLLYKQGESLVYVNLRMRHYWLLPLLVLLLGTSLGVAVSLYRKGGRPRDQILVQVGELKAQMQADTAFDPQTNPFAKRIDNLLYDVNDTLRQEQWEKGQDLLRKAYQLWRKWHHARQDWLNQYNYCQAMYRHIDKLRQDDFSMELRQGVKTIQDSFADWSTPQQLHDALYVLRKQALAYPNLIQRWQQFEQVYNRTIVNKGLDEGLKTAVRQLQTQIAQLRPLIPSLPAMEQSPDQEALLAKQMAQFDTLFTAIDELDDKLPRPATQGSRDLNLDPNMSFTTTPTMSEEMLQPVPSVFGEAFSDKVERAQRRLHLFQYTSYVALVGFLVGEGFNQLYLAQPTFGISPMSDYLGLLAWGFGAEASRDAVVKVIQERNQRNEAQTQTMT